MAHESLFLTELSYAVVSVDKIHTNVMKLQKDQEEVPNNNSEITPETHRITPLFTQALVLSQRVVLHLYTRRIVARTHTQNGVSSLILRI